MKMPKPKIYPWQTGYSNPYDTDTTTKGANNWQDVYGPDYTPNVDDLKANSKLLAGAVGRARQNQAVAGRLMNRFTNKSAARSDQAYKDLMENLRGEMKYGTFDENTKAPGVNTGYGDIKDLEKKLGKVDSTAEERKIQSRKIIRQYNDETKDNFEDLKRETTPWARARKVLGDYAPIAGNAAANAMSRWGAHAERKLALDKLKNKYLRDDTGKIMYKGGKALVSPDWATKKKKRGLTKIASNLIPLGLDLMGRGGGY
jgi:hypothetical protein